MQEKAIFPKETTTFEVQVEKLTDGSVKVAIGVENGKPPDFATLMCGCEYLMAVVACESNAGYEKALELLVKGAMTYRHLYKKGR